MRVQFLKDLPNIRLIYSIVLIIILIFGYVGNLLTVIILKYERRLRACTKTLLYVQTFWDTIVQLVVGTRYLEKVNNISSNYYIFDYTALYLTSLSMDCAMWTLSAITIERMCLVVWPTNTFIRQLTHKGALVVSFIFVVSSSLINICQYFAINYYYSLSEYMSLVYQVSIPTSLTCVGSVIIIHKIKAHFSKITPGGSSQNMQSPLFIIKMIVIIAVYSLFSAVPARFAIIFINKIIKLFLFNPIYIYTILRTVECLQMSNFALKFYLYTLTSSHMRNVLVEVFNKLKGKISKKSALILSETTITTNDTVTK